MSCHVKVSPKKQNTEKSLNHPVKVEPQVSINTPTLEISEGEKGTYLAHMTWPETNGFVSVFVNQEMAFLNRDPKQNSITLNLQASDGQVTRTYSLSLYKGDGPPHQNIYPQVTPTPLAQWTIQAPLDIDLNQLEPDGILTKDHDLPEAHRVFIENKIMTNGHALRIRTQQLLAQQAEIETFKEGAKAPLDQEGRGGGSIQILAGQASGHLKVTLRGEHGGDGRPGLPHAEARASKASDVKYICEVVSYSPRPHCRNCRLEPALPGRPLDGKVGAAGHNGFSGKKGGDTGLLMVTVLDPNKRTPLPPWMKSNEVVTEPFQISVEKISGLGGVGGPSGPPQMGGLGGQIIAENPICKGIMLAGKDNNDYGPIGQNGDPGPNGNLQKECLHLKPEDLPCEWLF